jgi:hypothetical protein
MGFGLFRRFAIACPFVVLVLGAGPVRAGDDGAAPLWVGVGSILGSVMGWSKDERDPIEYREHGKIVVPPKMDLPAPGLAAGEDAGSWPVNQEAQRKRIAKEAAKKEIAGQGDARLRYTHPFPNAPVTVRAADQDSATPGGKSEASSVLGTLNPMSWIGMGKSEKLGPEPDREWLTDPPKGYRAPVGQASN